MITTEFVKENPIKTTISVLTLVGLIIGFDSRYVKAGEFYEIRKTQEAMRLEQRQITNDAVKELHRQLIKDKLFELELIPPNKRNSTEDALIYKYRRTLEEYNK